MKTTYQIYCKNRNIKKRKMSLSDSIDLHNSIYNEPKEILKICKTKLPQQRDFHQNKNNFSASNINLTDDSEDCRVKSIFKNVRYLQMRFS